MSIQRSVSATADRRTRRSRRTKVAFAALAVVLAAVVVPDAAASAADRDDGDSDGLVWSRFVDLDFSAARIVIADRRGGNVRELSHAAAGDPGERVAGTGQDSPPGHRHCVDRSRQHRTQLHR